MGTEKVMVMSESSAHPEFFPLLISYWDRREMETLGCPRLIPWVVLLKHEDRALKNHGQSLKRLAERGGLDASETVAILEERPWTRMTNVDAVGKLKEFLDK